MHFRTLKMIATSGFLTALECTKFDFGRGSAPNPAVGVYSAPPDPDPLAGLRGPTSKGRGGKGTGKEGRGGRGRSRGGTGNGGNGSEEEGCQGKGREGERKGGKRRGRGGRGTEEK